MLSRVHSDASARLRRSKSTSTVQKCPTSIAESLDLDSIRQQALAAATTAFARAQAQNANEHANRHSFDLSRSKSNTSRKSMKTQGNHFPPRGSSFRSTHAPKAEQGKGRPQTFISRTEQTKEQPSRFHPTPASSDSLRVTLQLSEQPSAILGENAKPSFQQKIFRPSVASSVTSQQIRKARSMYYASSIQTGSPMARPLAKHLTPTPSHRRNLGSETSSIHPTSQTLGQSPLTEPHIPVTVAPGMTLNEARDEYLHEFQQSSMKHKPSLFLAPFKKRQDKAREKMKIVSSDTQLFTVSRENTSVEPTPDTNLNDFMPQQDLKEKRSFSGSLKNRIKRVFRLTSQKPTNLPVQHIKASRQYFDAPHLSPSSIGDTSSIPYPDETTLEHVRGRASSLGKARSAYFRSEYRSDSIGSGRSARSLHSELNAPRVPASRVTSWGTTSTSDTLTQRTIKRMTVIHESKDSIGNEAERGPSTTASRRKSFPLPLLSSFRDPMPIHSLPEEESSPVDPKRVFSALMREIGTTKSSQGPPVPAVLTLGAQNGVLESSTTMIQGQDLSSSGSHNVWTGIETNQRPLPRQPVVAHSVRSKTSTVKAFGKVMRSTIRAVTPAGQHLPPNPEPIVVAADAKSMHESELSSPSATVPRNDGSQGGSSTTKRQPTPLPFVPSASQIEKRMEKSRDRWKAHLEDPEHFQFPRETDKTYNITTFVRQTRETPSNSTKSSNKSEPYNSSMEEDSPQPPLSLDVPMSTSMEMPMSPSVYSRNTDGISVNLEDSVLSFDGPGELGQSQDNGSAVILTSRSARSYLVGTPSPQRQDVTRTSRDWRAWLSNEIAATGLSSHEDLTIDQAYGNFTEMDRSDYMHMSNTENKDTVVVVRDCLDATTSQLDTNTSAAANTSCRVENSGESREKINNSISIGAAFSEEHKSFSDIPITDHVSGASPDIATTSQIHNTSQSRSASPSSRNRPLSTTNIYASDRAGVDTPKRTPRNGQDILTNIIRCSSSNSLASPQSTSTANGMVLLNSSNSPKPTSEGTLHSTRPTNETLQHIAITPLKKHGTQVRRKENLTPRSLHAHEQSNPSPLSSLPRPKSNQLLSSSIPNHSSPYIDQPNIATPGMTTTKSPPTYTAASPRPRLRVIARPMSPEKRTQRPKSALNLQATSNLESLTRLAGFATLSSPPHERAHVRDSALHATLSPNSLSLYKEPSPARSTAATTFNGQCYARSATPGQRMADQFLRQRNSTIGSEERAGKRKGNKLFVREDTPAFL